MKKSIIKILVLFLGFFSLGLFKVQAQQQGQYSQYMMNYYLLNPAVSGTDDFLDVKLGYRNQWTGFNGAPQNFYASGNSPFNKIHSRHDKKFSKKMDMAHHAIGGMATGQTLGAMANYAAYVTYAYHIPLNLEWKMSLGASAGLLQNSLNQEKVEFVDNVPDVAVSGYNTLKPDMSFGVWFYSSKFFGGISSMQLFDNKLGNQGRLNRHYYTTAGYRIKLNRELSFIPSFLFKTVPNSAYQIDINAKMKYLNLFWGGVSYRNQDAIVFLSGITIKNLIDVGYSYDVNTSNISKYANGSHEVMLGFRLNNQAEIVSPHDFW